MSKTLVVSGWLPWWVLGVCGSYLLPSPAILPWIYAFFILLVLRVFTRWQVFLFGCALCAGIIFALWRTDSLLQNQWPLTDKASVQYYAYCKRYPAI